MTLQVQYEGLVTRLCNSLREYGYTDRDDSALDSVLDTVHFVARIMTPRRRLVRYVCAVLEAPEDLRDVDSAKLFLRLLRSTLSRAYARFPWWKELGTYTVLLCERDVYSELAPHVGQFADKTGLHMNVMLGTVLVDREGFQSTGRPTWGLFHSAKHYGAISATVTQWCDDERTTGGSA